MQTPKPPIVMLAFANDEGDHLALLKEESSQIREILFPLKHKDAIDVEYEESANVDELAGLFWKFDQRIAIFHYGGHAGGQGLRLEEGNAHASGLAEFFSQQKDSLQLVFLNGCSTLPQVQRLMDLGVRAVIATSCPIQDAKAVDFAKEFYRWLSANRSIGRAFESASAAIRTKYEDQEAPAIIEYRGIKLRQEKDDALPWGLYVNEKHKTVLNWRLPMNPPGRRAGLLNKDYEVNQYLLYVLEAMLFLDEDLRRNLTNEEGLLVDTNGASLNNQQKFYTILKHMPWPIGAQFQKLVAQRELNIERLKQIVSTYLVTAQTLLYLVVSQLLNYTSKDPKAVASILHRIININQQEFTAFDYLEFLKGLPIDRLFSAEKPPFVKEVIPFVRELKNEKSDLCRAYLQLEVLRDRLQAEDIDRQQAYEFYETSEANLTILLSRVAFLVKYKLLAVRDIQIVNHRQSEIRFQHRLGELNGVGDMLGLSPRELKHYTNSDSILLVRDIDDLEDEHLAQEIVNLTPFLIDDNAYLNYSSDALNIYIYAYRAGDTFYYYKVNSNVFNIFQKEESLLAVNDQDDNEADELFKKFLPFEQEAFLKKNESTAKVARPVRGKKKPNPYATIVRQLKSIGQSAVAS